METEQMHCKYSDDIMTIIIVIDLVVARIVCESVMTVIF